MTEFKPYFTPELLKVLKANTRMPATSEAYVKHRHPSAQSFAQSSLNGLDWAVLSEGAVLGRGDTEGETWEDAAKNIQPVSKNKNLLDSFTAYCQANPELRFWQALRNWSMYPFIYVSNKMVSKVDTNVPEETFFADTFYWEKRRHDGD